MTKWFQNKWVISLLAGLLLGLSFPPVNLTFLSFPAFILLFYLADQCESYKETAYYSYAGFVLWNLITTYWLMMASMVAGIAAILANSVLMTIPLCLGKYFSKKTGSPLWAAVMYAVTWVSYEFLHHHWDLSWPWLAIGNAWSNMISLIQYISVTGHLGISLWVVLTSALAYQLIKHRSRKLIISTLTVFLIFPIWSLLLFSSFDSPAEGSAESTEVAIIQPNHDSYQPYGGMSGLEEVIDKLFSLADSVRTPDTRLIIWPENAIDGVIRMNAYTANRFADSARSWNTNFLIGTSLYKIYEKDSGELYRDTYQNQPFNIFNSALYVYADGSKERYDKANLVPIVERIPFIHFLDALDVFNWVNWGKIQGFGKGAEATVMETDNFGTSGLVCYDSVYPTWVRNFVQNGATFITIITNDGWWGNTSGHHQHFAYARLRAIEFDRWVARSANNGISGIIDPAGQIHKKTDYWVRTGFTFDIPVKQSQTFYTRFGNWLPIFCLALSLCGWLFYLIRERLR